MRHISHKTVYIKNPDTNEYEGLPALRGEPGLPGIDVASIHVGEEEPTNENCVAWITPEGSSSVNLPEINDGEINAVDTWSSQKINDSINSLNLKNGSLNNDSLRQVSASSETETYSLGECAVALGNRTVASGDYSYAEGSGTTASGDISHAEGEGTTASEYTAHAEGNQTVASGFGSHAEGCLTNATGIYSHTEGHGTVATGWAQHVQGTYNIPDEAEQYLHIVGNGATDAPSNAHTLSNFGDAWFAGNVYIGGTAQDNGAVALKPVASNLLDNSYFPEAVNQRGVMSTTTWGICLDRWHARAAGIGITVDANGLHLASSETGNVFLYQKIKIPAAQMLGKTYTVAYCDGNGNIACGKVTLPSTEPTTWTTYVSATAGNTSAGIMHIGSGTHGFCVRVGRQSNNTDDGVIRWVALYEGSYTLNTLPAYMPKENELAKCKEYAVKTKGHGWGYTVNSTTLRLNIPVPTTLRITPSIPAGLTFTVVVDGSAKTITEYAVNTMDNGVVRLTLTGTDFPSTRMPIVGYANKEFVFSSDL